MMPRDAMATRAVRISLFFMVVFRFVVGCLVCFPTAPTGRRGKFLVSLRSQSRAFRRRSMDCESADRTGSTRPFLGGEGGKELGRFHGISGVRVEARRWCSHRLLPDRRGRRKGSVRPSPGVIPRWPGSRGGDDIRADNGYQRRHREQRCQIGFHDD